MRTISSTDPIYQGFIVNTSHGGYYPVIMARILQCHRYATTTRGRNLFLMLTFTIPQNRTYQEGLFSSFLEVFIRQANRDGLAPVYCWVREQACSPNPHFHLGLWFSGYWRRNPFGIINDLQARWNRCFDLPPEYRGLVSYSQRQPSIFLDREAADYEVNQQLVVYWASYAAKVAEKSVSPHCRAYGSSSVPNVNFI